MLTISSPVSGTISKANSTALNGQNSDDLEL